MNRLQSESLSGKCAKCHTVAATNNRDQQRRSLSSSPLATTINCSSGSQALLEVTHQDHSIGITLLFLVRATYIMVLFFTHIPLVVNHTINATPAERLQHYHSLQYIYRTLQLLIFLTLCNLNKTRNRAVTHISYKMHENRYKSDMQVRPIRLTISCTPTNSSDKTFLEEFYYIAVLVCVIIW